MSVSPRLSLKDARLVPRKPAVSLEFRVGLHALVTESPEFAAAFISNAAGLSEPQRSLLKKGRVRLGGRNPFTSPEVRAKTGSVLPYEELLKGYETVKDGLEAVLKVRNRRDRKAGRDTAQVVRPESLPLTSRLLERAPHTLTSKEQHRLALGLALSLKSPIGLFLYRPLVGLDWDETELVLARLRALAEEDAVVVCVTPSRREAERLSPRIIQVGLRSFSNAAKPRYLIRCTQPQELRDELKAEDVVLSCEPSSHETSGLIVTLENEFEALGAFNQRLARAPGILFQVRRLATSEGGASK